MEKKNPGLFSNYIMMFVDGIMIIIGVHPTPHDFQILINDHMRVIEGMREWILVKNKQCCHKRI